MREIRLSGSEGGGNEANRSSLYQIAPWIGLNGLWQSGALAAGPGGRK